MIRRREFITLLGGAAAWPVKSRAQQQVSTKRPLIGFLSSVLRERNLQMIDAFVQGLRKLDYIEGRDFDFAYRSADGHLDRSRPG